MAAQRNVLVAAGTALAAAAAVGWAGGRGPATKPAAPADNLEYWLGRAMPAASQPAGADANDSGGESPFPAPGREFRRDDALPGVIELSDGRQLPGGLYTTRERPWIVWQDKTQSWRHIPFINVLSITAVVEEERTELEWRWKAMGEPEKVYTGRSYPMRRLHWRFRLLDGSVVEGSTKGQPVWVEFRGRSAGPFVLHERMKGALDTKLADLIYIRKIVVSRRMMDAVTADVDRKLAAPGGKTK